MRRFHHSSCARIDNAVGVQIAVRNDAATEIELFIRKRDGCGLDVVAARVTGRQQSACWTYRQGGFDSD
jgi:hypothetical protein